MSEEERIVTTTKIVGFPEPSLWSQVSTLTNQSMEEDDHLGKLDVVIEIGRSDSEEAAFFGKAVLDAMQNAYFAKQADKIFTALSRAMAEGNTLINRELLHLTTFAIVALVRQDNTIYVARIGKGNILLFRAGKAYSLLSESTGIESASGVLKPSDYIIAGTNSFFEHAYPTQELFDGDSTAQQIGDVLTPILLALPQNADTAGLIMAVPGQLTASENQATQIIAPALEIKKEKPEIPQAVPIAIPTPTPPVTVPQSTPAHPLQNSEAVPFSGKKEAVTKGIPASFDVHQLFKHARPIVYAVKQATTLKKSSAPNISRQTKTFSGKQLKRLLLFVAVILVVALIIWAISAFNTFTNRREAAALITTAQQKVVQAQAIKGQDTKQAAALLREAQEVILKAKAIDKNATVPSDLLSVIAQQEKELFAIEAVKDPEPVFDLTFIKEGFSGTRLSLSQTTMAAVDPKAPTVLALDVGKKTGAIATGGTKVPGFIDAVVADETVFILTAEGIYSVTDTTGDTRELVKKDPLWQKPIAIASYAENIYVLDAGKGQIWKYTGTNGTYSSIRNVINEGEDSLLQSPTALAIDGAIWVVEGNTVLLIEGGKKRVFTVDNLDVPLKQNLKVASATESKHIYLLDPQNKRVVVVSKEGPFVRQITSDSFAEAQDIAVAANEQELYIMTQTKVFKVPLRP